MKRINITIAEAQKLDTGSHLLWEETSMLYTREKDGVFKGLPQPIESFCKCPCHESGNSVMHCIPCCSKDPDILYVVKSSDYKNT